MYHIGIHLLSIHLYFEKVLQSMGVSQSAKGMNGQTLVRLQSQLLEQNVEGSQTSVVKTKTSRRRRKPWVDKRQSRFIEGINVSAVLEVRTDQRCHRDRLHRRKAWLLK